MGRLKEFYKQTLKGNHKSEDGIMYKGKIYKDYQDNNGYVKYSLIECPLCGEKILKKYEMDDTSGFGNWVTSIQDRICKCDLKPYYKKIL